MTTSTFRRSAIALLALPLLLAACTDPTRPTRSRTLPPSVRDRISVLNAAVSPRPEGADTVDYYPDNLHFTTWNPCTGDSVRIDGVAHERGWEMITDSTKDHDILARGDTVVARGVASGVRYDIIYYNQQRLHQELDSAGVWHTVAHVHKLWFLVHEFTWQTYLYDSEYDLTNPPVSVTYTRGDKLCGEW